MTVAPFAPGRIVTAGMLARPYPYQTGISTGSSSGSTEVITATLVVPAQPIPTIQVAEAYWTGNPTAGNERWLFAIRETNLSGTSLGSQQLTTPTDSQRRCAFSLGPVSGRLVDAGVAATYVVTLQQLSGSGTIANSIGGLLTVNVTPNLP